MNNEDLTGVLSPENTELNEELQRAISEPSEEELEVKRAFIEEKLKGTFYEIKDRYSYDTTKDGIFGRTTEIYCNWWNKERGEILGDVEAFKGGLMQAYDNANFNAGRVMGNVVKNTNGDPKRDKNGNYIYKPLYKMPDNIPAPYVSMITARTGLFSKIPDTTGLNEIAVYYKSGKLAHLWRRIDDVDPTAKKNSRIEAERIIEQFNGVITDREKREVIGAMFTKVNTRKYNTDKDLIPCENGVFQYTSEHNGIIIPWEVVEKEHPEWTFKNKIPFRIIPFNQIQEPHIVDRFGNEWHVIESIKSLMDNEEAGQALLEMMGASLRPQAGFDCAGLFLDGTPGHAGNNGKSTITQTIEDLHGGVDDSDGQIAVMQIKDFADRFKKVALKDADLIISHENDPKFPANALSDWKTAITGDAMGIEGKYKNGQSIRPNVFMVQCFNILPAMGDLSGSNDRRIRPLLFKKTFTNTGKEDPDIKRNYLKRRDVLEYLLSYLVYEIGRMDNGIPWRSCYEEGMSYFKSETDVVSRFVHEVLDKEVISYDDDGNETGRKDYIHNDYISSSNLYEIFICWYIDTFKSDKYLLSKPEFLERLPNAVNTSRLWNYKAGSVRIPYKDGQPKAGINYGVFEPVIDDYCVVNLMKDKGVVTSFNTLPNKKIYNKSDWEAWKQSEEHKKQVKSMCVLGDLDKPVLNGAIVRKK